MKLVFKIQKPAAEIFHYLADANRFVEVHPVITKMIRNSDNSYRVYERLKLGFLPVQFTYRAFIESYQPENKIHMKAIVSKFTTIDISFSLCSYGDITWIEDSIDVKSTWLLSGIIKRILKTQHEKLFKNITRLKNEFSN